MSPLRHFPASPLLPFPHYGHHGPIDGLHRAEETEPQEQSHRATNVRHDVDECCSGRQFDPQCGLLCHRDAGHADLGGQ